MARANALVAGLGAALALASGCAVATGLDVGPTWLEGGGFGAEARASLQAAVGTPELRAGGAITAGAGALGGGSGYGFFGGEVFAEGGQAARWQVGVPVELRFAPGLDFGGGIAGSVVFQMSSGAEHGGLFIGPRVAVEAFDGSDGSAALVQVDLVLRWVLFDSSGNSW
ncbi:MAG: hypothetical protein U1F43_28675 [Myxococcota bacterium]